MLSRLRRIVLPVALIAGVIVGASSVASATGSGTVAPSAGLADGQTVHVTFSGYQPNQVPGVAIVECAKASPTAVTDCNSGFNPQKDLTYVNTDGTGSGAADVVVNTLVGPNNCVTTPTCVMLVASVDKTILNTFPISFGPSATATPSTGLTDGQTVNVAIFGYQPSLTPGAVAVECDKAAPTAATDCNSGANPQNDLTFMNTDSSGNASSGVVVNIHVGSFNCITTPTCVLLVSSLDHTILNVLPITFAAVTPPSANPGNVGMVATGAASTTLGTTPGTNPVGGCSLDASPGATLSGNYGTGGRLAVVISNSPTPCHASLTDTGTSGETVTFQFWAFDSSSNVSASSATETITISASTPVTQAIQETINPGSSPLVLSCNAPGSAGYPLLACPTATLPPVTLDGLAHTTTGPASTIYVSDNRGQAAAWTLSAQLVASPTVAGTACTGAVEFCNSLTGSDPANPNNHLGKGTLAIGTIACAPYTGTANPAPTNGAGGSFAAIETLCTAIAGQNTGTFTMNAQYALQVPASVFSGLYQGTVQYLVA